jgi:alpha-D-xyloside xylohydrolase
MKNICIVAAALLLMTGCKRKNSGFTKLNNGIVVDVAHKTDDNATAKVRLEVFGEKIIRVTATPEIDFPTDRSLIIVPQSSHTPFSVEEDAATVYLKTTQLTVAVGKTTGDVRFCEPSGTTILQEEPDGKSFKPFEDGYTVGDVFLSPDDEAFYGLGQHQSDEFNYKSKNEELYQYNTKVSVPFVVSNKGYGLLWDSYSYSRFGDSRDYMQLNRAFRLYDNKGSKGGLSGIYTSGENKITRREDSLYFENQKTITNLPAMFPLFNATVIYEGYLEPLETGNYRFILFYAGYVKVFVDNKEIVSERWRTAWNPNSYKFTLPMEAGKKAHLKIEWRPDGVVSYLGLRALTPVDDSKQSKQSWWSELNSAIDYYFIKGTDADDVIGGYRQLTGKAPVMPLWAMGYWQSRERYKTQYEVLDALKEFRRRRIPVDNIVLDWNYWREDYWGSHEFDPQFFPSPKTMIDSIHALNARFMISVWPKFYMNTEHFKEFDAHGWMYRQAVRDSLRDWVGQGYIGSFYDAYASGARKLFWHQMYEHLYTLGVDAWWMDASEPNIRDCTDFEYRKALQGPTALGSASRYFNTYALMNAEAIYSGQRGADPDKRVFLLTRSGFAGLQRYSTATWSGDIAARWEDMKAQIPAGLNYSISGIPYWTMDIGGFCVENRYIKSVLEYQKTGYENDDLKEWRELNTRWYQFGAFCPLFRTHGQFPYREVWNIAPDDHPAYKSIVYYIKLRYRLMPYIYTLAGMTLHNDYTIMRPLTMDFPHDKEAENIGDEYLFGPSILVAPVYEYNARRRRIYFPKQAGWYDFYTGKYASEGGMYKTVDAPYERMPLYVCEGAIIPFGPDVLYTDEKPDAPLDVYVYAGRDGHFTLYEDEGVNYNYEQGKYSHIPFVYSEKEHSLTIGERRGSYKGMPLKRIFNIKIVDKEGIKETKTVLYDGTKYQLLTK